MHTIYFFFSLIRRSEPILQIQTWGKKIGFQVIQALDLKQNEKATGKFVLLVVYV